MHHYETKVFFLQIGAGMENGGSTICPGTIRPKKEIEKT